MRIFSTKVKHVSTYQKSSKKTSTTTENNQNKSLLEENETVVPNLDKKVKDMMWPFVKSSPLNNIDKRFKNQEKLLQEQHEMIKGRYLNLCGKISKWFF